MTHLTKYCIDCNWSIKMNHESDDIENDEDYYCRNPNLGVNYITGKTIPVKCTKARTRDYCGFKAQWFEPKVVWYKKIFSRKKNE